jgi:uncharacterized membrane protein YfhO
VDPDLPAEIPRAADPGAGELSPEEREHFDGLQQRNRILRVDRGRANRMLIEAEMATPAMLVITECWHPGWRAEVDGRPVPLWQVNYLQQGLWVEPGRHTIRLGFFPRSVRWGALVSALSAVIAAVAALCPAWRRPDRSGQSRG